MITEQDWARAAKVIERLEQAGWKRLPRSQRVSPSRMWYKRDHATIDFDQWERHCRTTTEVVKILARETRYRAKLAKQAESFSECEDDDV